MASEKIRKTLTKRVRALGTTITCTLLTCAITWGGEHVLNTLSAFITGQM